MGLLLVILLLGCVVLTTTPTYLEHWVNAYVLEIPDKSREELLRDYKFFSSLVCISMGLPLALLGTVFVNQGYRVYDSNQYLYPRMMVLRDAPLETGTKARQRATRFFILGGSLLVCSVLISWYLYATLMQVLMSVRASN